MAGERSGGGDSAPRALGDAARGGDRIVELLRQLSGMPLAEIEAAARTLSDTDRERLNALADEILRDRRNLERD